MSVDGNNRLRLYRQSLVKAWGCVDYNDWPIKLNAAFHLFLEEFSAEFLDDITYLESERGIALADIARAMNNPARVYRIIDASLYGLKRSRTPLVKQRQTTLKLLDMVKALKYGSEFNENGINEILSPSQVALLADKVPVSCTPFGARLIHQFCGAMWSYTESIFFRAHDVTKEIHGPYPLQDGKVLVVKDYLNLRPTEIWGDMPLLPCNSIRIVKKYAAGVNLTIDALNHLYSEQKLLIPHLEGYFMIVDGILADEDMATGLLEKMKEAVSAISSGVDEMSWNERVAKYAEIFWFRKRPVRDLRGLPWHVPAKVRERIAIGTDNSARRERLSAEQVSRLGQITI